jgi:hypothetical protein
MVRRSGRHIYVHIAVRDVRQSILTAADPEAFIDSTKVEPT